MIAPHFKTRPFRTLAAATLLASVPLTAAHAVILTNLYNTGVDASHVALAGGDGIVDSHYTIATSGLVGVNPGDATYTYFNPAYVPESATSRWISYSGSPFIGSGAFAVTTTFDLTGYDPTTAAVSGLWGVDNDGEIFLNGVSTGFTLTGSSGSNFNALHAFSLNSGFVAGLNTLTIAVADSGPPAAFRLDGLVASANLAVPTIPEPAAWALMIAGFAMVGATMRRRKLVRRIAA